MKVTIWSLSVWVCFCVLPLSAQELSSIPGAFVDIGFGARPVALGSAYVGLAEDVNSIVWNPAGLADGPDYEAAFSYVDQLDIIDYQYFAISGPIPGGKHNGGVAVISSGDDAYRETAFYATYARTLHRFAVGATVKYRNVSFGNNVLNAEDFVVFEPDEIQQGIANQVYGNAIGFGLDLGILYRPNQRMGFGLMLRDVIAPLNWNSSSNNPEKAARGSYNENVPFEMAIGTVYRVSEAFLVTADYGPAFSEEISNKIRVGLEVTIMKMLSLRCGMQQFVNNLDDEKYAMGFGLQVPVVANLRVRADYTYLIEQLTNTHHVSLAVLF